MCEFSAYVAFNKTTNGQTDINPLIIIMLRIGVYNVLLRVGEVCGCACLSDCVSPPPPLPFLGPFFNSYLFNYQKVFDTLFISLIIIV